MTCYGLRLRRIDPVSTMSIDTAQLKAAVDPEFVGPGTLYSNRLILAERYPVDIRLSALYVYVKHL